MWAAMSPGLAGGPEMLDNAMVEMLDNAMVPHVGDQR